MPTGWKIISGTAILALAAFLWGGRYTPTFVVFHLLFAPLLWLLLRAPNVTLSASLLLYALVHVFGWPGPAWPNSHWFFNPLAWQLLVVFRAWWVIEGKRFWPCVTPRTAFLLATLYL